MNKLNLRLGQKVWSIQLGECEVVEINENKTYKCKPLYESKIDWINYESNGKISPIEYHQSLFLSNPFEKKLVLKNNDGWNEPKEKADTISALLMVYEDCSDTELKKISREKLQKLLESI